MSVSPFPESSSQDQAATSVAQAPASVAEPVAAKPAQGTRHATVKRRAKPAAASAKAAQAATTLPAAKPAGPANSAKSARPSKVAKPANRSTTTALAKPVKPTAPAKKPTATSAARKPAKPAQPKANKPAAAPLSTDSAAAKPPRQKDKLVRDSFTMPRADFALIQQLKDRALGFQHAAKKSELLRAGLHALAGMDTLALLALLTSLPTLKSGRPKKGG